jgi:hypothetical protein
MLGSPPTLGSPHFPDAARGNLARASGEWGPLVGISWMIARASVVQQRSAPANRQE